MLIATLVVLQGRVKLSGIILSFCFQGMVLRVINATVVASLFFRSEKLRDLVVAEATEV